MTAMIWTYRGTPVDDLEGEEVLREALRSLCRQLEEERRGREQDERMGEMFDRVLGQRR